MSRIGRRAAYGVVYCLVLALLVTLCVGIYRKAMPWQRTAEVTLVAARAGLGLNPQSDVKFQGVLVGQVSAVHPRPDGVRVDLAIEKDKLALIPASVSPRVVPKTLFGDKFVDLVGSPDPGPSRLRSGQELRVSQVAVEVSDLFSRLEPILAAVDPAKLSTVLSVIAEVLHGRGGQIAATLDRTREFLEQVDPHLPTLVADLRSLGRTADVYAEGADDLGTILTSAAGLSQDLLVPRQRTFDQMLDQVTGVSKQTSDLLDTSGDTLVKVSGRLEPVTELLEEYSSVLGCTITGTRIVDTLANEVMGSRGPYVSLTIDMLTDQAPYTYPDDLPTNPSSTAHDSRLPAIYPGWEPHCPEFTDAVLAMRNHGPYSQLLPGVVLDLDEARGTDEAGSGQTAPAGERESAAMTDAAVARAREALARAMAASLTSTPQDEVPGYAGMLLTPLVSDGEVDLP
ncbi:MCE family protein [Nocardioides sp. NPDC059952]|uniref:MCE family protein n=1 Tax=Nocardioides sp. NPDC059952 TaxID=3347014 RepID=UPI003648D67F